MSDASKKIIIKKIKKGGHEGHHGGSWKVAYADFVTAMMAFFLLLWLITMVSSERRAVLANYFKNFSLFEQSGKSFMTGSAFIMDDVMKKAEINADDFGRQLKKTVQEKLQGVEDQVMVDRVTGNTVMEGIRIQIVDKEGSSMFPLGSAEPTSKAKKILALVYDNIKDLKTKIIIEGHTDGAPFRGDQISNWELSTARASSARRELEANGLEPSRIARVIGYADTELFNKEDPKDAKNRRISIILLQKTMPAGLSTNPLKKGSSKSIFDQSDTTAQTQPMAPQPEKSASPSSEAMKESPKVAQPEGGKAEKNLPRFKPKKDKNRDIIGIY
jgi:chemotaxis protein MotB